MIKADISSGGKNYHLVDWEVYKVDRNKSNDIMKFESSFTSVSDEKINYSEGDVVLLTIIPPGVIPEETLPVLKFVVDKVNVLGVQFKLVTE